VGFLSVCNGDRREPMCVCVCVCMCALVCLMVCVLEVSVTQRRVLECVSKGGPGRGGISVARSDIKGPW
jgi:hypothetical protein